MMALLELVPRWLLLAAVVALGGLAGVQTVRLVGARSDLAEATKALAEMSVEVAKANAKAAQQAAEFSNKVIEAQNEAKQRETRLRAAADAARTESDGLRGDIGALRDQLANASRDAAVERAAAIADVLGQCAQRHQALAERCDRHVSDIRTLTDAWPK